MSRRETVWGETLPSREDWARLRPDLVRRDEAAARYVASKVPAIPPMDASTWLVLRVLLAVAVAALVVKGWAP